MQLLKLELKRIPYLITKLLAKACKADGLPIWNAKNKKTSRKQKNSNK